MNGYASNIGQELLNVPMGDMIRDMALAIADAQITLDENSIEVAEMMGGLKSITDSNGDVTFSDSRVFFGQDSMLLSEAAAVHNTTTDASLKSYIALEVMAPAITAGNIQVVPMSSPTAYEIVPTTGVDSVVLLPSRISMLELGFTPTFYQFVDTIIEVKIAIKYSAERSSEVEVNSNSKTVSRFSHFTRTKSKGSKKVTRSRSRNVTTTQVNATYASKFSYTAEGSSLLRTKLVPIPPPAILEERIRAQMAIAETVIPS